MRPHYLWIWVSKVQGGNRNLTTCEGGRKILDASRKGGRKMLDLISFFNVPKTQLFHVLGYFGHFSFFVQVGGTKNFKCLVKGGAKNFKRILKGG